MARRWRIGCSTSRVGRLREQLLRPVAGQDVLPRVRHFHAAPAGEQQPALEQVQSDLYLEAECRQQLPVFHDSRWPTARDSLPQHAFAPFVGGLHLIGRG